MNFKYADPEILKVLDNFIIESNNIVEGKHSGKHRSYLVGRSLEFVQHRDYTVGDDLRYIDWKVYARRDRFFIKQFYRETNFEAWIFVDCSKSMWFPKEQKEFTKYQYANFIASYLSYILLNQGDSVGLVKFDKEIKDILKIYSGKHFYYRILQFLENEVEGEKTDFFAIFNEILKLVKKRSLLVLISDLILDERTEVIKFLKQISSYGIYILVLHIVSQKERSIENYDFQNVTFKDIEDPLLEIKTNIYEIKQMYKKEFEDLLEYYKKELNQKNIKYFLIDTSLPILENINLILKYQ
jgi:uncharacterized protein (DUF58 family)